MLLQQPFTVHAERMVWFLLLPNKEQQAAIVLIMMPLSVSATISNKIKLHNADEFAAIAPAQDQGGDVDALDAILQTGFSDGPQFSFQRWK